MTAVAEETGGGISGNGCITMIDETYEFTAPRFFDFINGESDEDKRKAELWFDTDLFYAPSPFMPKIKTSRSITVDSLCDFSEADKMQETSVNADNNVLEANMQPQCMTTKIKDIDAPCSDAKEEISTIASQAPCSGAKEENNITASHALCSESKEEKSTTFSHAPCNGAKEENNTTASHALCSESKEEKSTTFSHAPCTGAKEENNKTSTQAPCSESKKENNTSASHVVSADKERSDNDHKGDSACLSGVSSVEVGKDACTPNPTLQKRVSSMNSKKQQTAKKIAMNAKHQLRLSAMKSTSVEVGKDACTPNPTLQKRVSSMNSKKQQTAKKIAMSAKHQLMSSAMKSSSGTPNLTQENQAIKRQKLEGGKTRQILNVKNQVLPHKSKLGLTTSNANSLSTSKSNREDRKVYVRETPKPASVPFVSTAEMMRRFQSSTRDLSLNSAISNMKPKLTLTRPKEPEFETTQRARPARVKSTAELEEEMMAKMPKFKARPLNKKILQTPMLPPIPRSTPQPPEFKEFHLETMARAHQNADSASVASTELSNKENPGKPHHLTEPKTPILQTSLRARPDKVKSSLALEQEELEKIPKFKARPLNKKIFESKGEIGIFCNTKKHVTEPQEFHFATNERIPPPAAMADLFDKLSLKSEPARNHNPIPRNTTPNPFHLHTEERGAEKERRLYIELLQKQLEEERARVPKANPYPYTTDYPVVPPKPEPKQCTKPEPFQLESLLRHEEEMQREMEERLRMERAEAEMRRFKAQPVLKEDPIPVPEKVRKPLTQVQGFNLHVEHRAVDRAQFDEKIKEKEMMYKRYREESEAERMIEEEKALKQLRRTMVPHARPVPNFDNPFCPRKSAKDTTKPKSLNLHAFKGTVASSPASSMR